MTDRYAIFGNPVAHSKSPQIHAEFARETGQDISYQHSLVEREDFSRAVDAFRLSGAAGANVTVPFKVQAYHCATELTPRARRCGAVNTLKFDGATILGDNTDGLGLCADLDRNLRFMLADTRILVIGAGGAARGVMGNLVDARPKLLVVTNRSIRNAEAITQQFNDAANINIRVMPVTELPLHQFDLIINATSTSLTNELPPVPPASFTAQTLAYDMVYGRGQTPFLVLAANAGARTADGLGMLVEQAAESFLLWRGVRPNTAPVLAMLRKQLAHDTY